MLESLNYKNMFSFGKVCYYLGTLVGFVLTGSMKYIRWLGLVDVSIDFEVMAEPHVDVLVKACR
jgi:hypothetical protein